MDIIIPANRKVQDILGLNLAETDNMRPYTFCMRTVSGKDVLYFNVLTRELIHYDLQDEQSDAVQAYLRDHWFLVKEDSDDFALASQINSIIGLMQKKTRDPLKSFIIFTTTDCNARCFYCFEKGCPRIDMTESTADAVSEFIIKRSSDEESVLNWFGGEPLFNSAVIDRICENLLSAGKKFSSSMISNGYLFHEEHVQKASGLWNLKEVQITLDGTEDIYNRTKSFIYREGSAYRTVLDNIRRLLNSGIAVTVRLNMDRYNFGDLMKLVEELKNMFDGEKLLTVYSAPLSEQHMNKEIVSQRRRKIYSLQRELTEQLDSYGLAGFRKLNRSIPINQCMADSGKCVVILPDGKTGLCEHYTDRELIGNIWQDEEDLAVIEAWSRIAEPVEACRTCAVYPQCHRIEKCPNYTACFSEWQGYVLFDLKFRMKKEYENWLNKGSSLNTDIFEV